MKITEALRIIQAAPAAGAEFVVTLACGFTSLHLQTFLQAHLQQRLAARRVRLETGLFGDLAGTLEAAPHNPAHAIAIALEWPDIDSRLGYRQLGGWGPADVSDVVAHSSSAIERIGHAIERIPASVPIGISLPTLPLPPVFHTPACRASAAELELRHSLSSFARCLGSRANVAVVSDASLAEISPPAGRFDLKSELLTGLPYTVAHADALAAALAATLAPKPPKKGLITDLDDTLWNGISGEIGPEAVSWDLASHAQIHGLYQQVLRALAEQGALIGVASKNDPAVVERAFARVDILLPADKVFPIEAHWDAKSGSVERILRTWNIGADSVVFIDDSPMELAEVKAAHPEIECIQFPKDDYAAACALLRRLRDLFGKTTVSEEDAIRLESIRQGAEFRRASEDGRHKTQEEFLAQAGAAILLDFGSTAEPRTLELVNKTNQFNLNGLRFTEADWQKALEGPDAFLLGVGYQDKFGPLGKIAVLQGWRAGRALHIGTWVMSCRAFARRIEYQCLEVLFARFAVEEMHLDFAPTAKNGPIRQFLVELLGIEPKAPVVLPKGLFLEKRPKLYHKVNELNG